MFCFQAECEYISRSELLRIFLTSQQERIFCGVKSETLQVVGFLERCFVAGGLNGPFFPVFNFKNFAVAFEGIDYAVDQFWGVILAALLVGVVKGITVAIGYAQASTAVIYLLMLLVLLFRPRGLFGERIQRFE